MPDNASSFEEGFLSALVKLIPASVSSLAVALSGGADSTALALLARHWRDAVPGRRLLALTVDHGLRAESLEEAKQVAKQCKTFDIPHRIISWEQTSQEPLSNLHHQAREARYHLMGEVCVEENISYLLTGHHLDDQAETVLLRLFRGSGVDGLAAMAEKALYPVELVGGKVELIRPLLSFPKEMLVEYLRYQKVEWIEDPSNHHPRFARTQIRALLESLGEERALTVNRLSDTAMRMARVKSYLETQTDAAMAGCVRWHEEGYASLNRVAFSTLHEEIGLRVLSHVLCTLGGHSYRLRMEKLDRAYQYLLESENGQAITLAGCVLLPSQKKGEKGRVLILRELEAISGSVPIIPGHQVQWDNRFLCEIRPPLEARITQIQALGKEGYERLLQAKAVDTHTILLPKRLIYTLPALVSLETVLAVPHIGYYAQGISRDMIHIRRAIPSLLN